MPEARDPVIVPGMGHAFDPVGYQSICEALDWTLLNHRQDRRKSTMSND